jgi:uncharacterized protein (DUF302 family)
MSAFEVTLVLDIDAADGVVRSALADGGFGVMTEIDIAGAFAQKLGVERPALRILGACNPQFAYEAISIDPRASLALPCNVVLEDVGGATLVRVVDPRDLMTDIDLNELADRVASQLAQVTAALQRRPEAAPAM